MPLLSDIDTRIIDASSAYRTHPEWVYGFPEISEVQRDLISKANLVTNPGCFATGAISILRPLVDESLIDPAQTHTVFGVSGYTGGGKKLIERHDTADEAFKADNAFGLYSVNSMHKHVPEIKKHAGLVATPIFMPNVISQPRGMIVSVPFNRASLDGDISDVHNMLEEFYSYDASMVQVMPIDPEQRRINFASFTQLNLDAINPIPHVELHITGWSHDDDSQVTVHALLDNLGKGAGAQVVQNMALMLDGL
jgi:N-acetyl-gamma-glutamyl-phosphate reductase